MGGGVPNVQIKSCISEEGHPFSEVFIDHEGQRFYSRYFYPMDDTPGMRAQQGQQFLVRLKRFPRQ